MRISLLQETMLVIRLLEDRLQQLCDVGEAGDLHFGKGQEAIAVGVCAALGKDDLVLTHHRMIPWAVSKGVPIRRLVAELLGKAEGLCGGLAGEMHLRAMEYGFAHSFQLVGTVVPVAAGVAWAQKNCKKNGAITVAVLGDAATANSQFHEGLNIAAVQGLPLLLICENNQLAGNVRPEHYRPRSHEPIAYRVGMAYGIENDTVDGNNVEAVHKAAGYAAGRVRDSGDPFLLECDTTRLGKHKQGQGDLRSKEEMAELWERDPLKSARFDAEKHTEIMAELDELIAEVRALPGPALPKEDALWA